MTEFVRNVSDTARWVAAYRAEETKRADALFRDPLAERLAGQRGPAIAQRASLHGRWVLITRTCVIDEYVNAAVKDGCDRVLNLAAGFDTRPYRLDLPAELEWVEADLPELVSEKNQLLAGETPRCRLDREAVDLSDPAALDDFLSRRLAGAKKPTVISEGLVIYLDESVVIALSSALRRHGVQNWILDFNSPRVNAAMNASMRHLLGNAQFKFAPANGIAYFENLGWALRELRPLFHEGARLKRLPLLMRPFALIPPPNPRALERARWTGVVWLKGAEL